MYSIIKTEQQYKEYLELLDEVFDAKPETPEGDKAEHLTLLITSYEQKKFTIDFSELNNLDPIERIKLTMENKGLKAADLVNKGVFDKTTASLILNKKRTLTLEIIRKLSPILKLSMDILGKEYELEESKTTKDNFYVTA